MFVSIVVARIFSEVLTAMFLAGQKRKRTVLTLDRKSRIINELEKGVSQRIVAETFGVAKS